MFKRSDRDLLQLQRELLAVEEEMDEEPEEEFDEEYDEEYNGEFDENFEENDEEIDYEDCFESDYEEEYEEESFRPGHLNRYKRGNPKKFQDDDFFDEGFDDGDVLYRKDYKKAKRKKRRKAVWLFILALLELAVIGAILLWVISWIQ